MRTEYDQLLDAAIRQLRALKDRGVRFIDVSPEALASRSARVPPAGSGGVPPPGRSPDKTLNKPAGATPAPRRIPLPAQPPAPSAIEPVSFEMPDPSTPKEAALAQLRTQALACQQCPHLVQSRKNVVFGVGNIDAALMFIGEAPGADEDEQGQPFVGKAGQLLTRIIQAMGLARETVFIANVLKCRPDTPGQVAGNRKPTADEMKTCLPYLMAQIELIRPRAIVALGGTAVEGLFGKSQGIMKLRGNWMRLRDTPVMPTYHPAFLLRNQSMAQKRKVWEDMLKVMECLQMPISQKQRNYFLKNS